MLRDQLNGLTFELQYKTEKNTRKQRGSDQHAKGVSVMLDVHRQFQTTLEGMRRKSI